MVCLPKNSRFRGLEIGALEHPSSEVSGTKEKPKFGIQEQMEKALS